MMSGIKMKDPLFFELVMRAQMVTMVNQFRNIIASMIVIIFVMMILTAKKRLKKTFLSKKSKKSWKLNTTLNPKVVRKIKNLQASFNEDANEIVKEAKQDKPVSEYLNFLID